MFLCFFTVFFFFFTAFCIVFEVFCNVFYLEHDKISEFNLNLLSLDSEQLGIPDTEYSSIVTLPSSEFTRICRELSSIAETGIFFSFF